MLVLDQLARLSADEVRCRITRDGTSWEFTVRFSRQGEALRTLDLEGLSPTSYWELRNCDEYRAFMKILWAYADGASVELPKEIIADWTSEGRANVSGTGPGGLARGKVGEAGEEAIRSEINDRSPLSGPVNTGLSGADRCQPR
jgi:hypothetical protein